ncbi:MAG: methyltransferase domain-containing protein [Burkholderiales bacterium]|nr:methyltransferase domain-containing protein [Flavobacterium sp.]
MSANFDVAAANYDQTFTHTVIGKLQRQHVCGHLAKILRESTPRKVLEINCGTGEDAIWLARQNFEVTATDLSHEMIAVAKKKGDFKDLNFQQADINDLASHFGQKKYDLIFSNFGGLNCLSPMELKMFCKNAAELLSEKGQMVLVIMPENTLWEQFYFLGKANFKDVFRRKKGNIIANVEGQMVNTYYYNPNEIMALADPYFNKIQLNPIGFFVPPSYLEPYFKNKLRLISFLNRLESKVQHQEWLAKYADHYVIIFQKR